MLVKCYNGLHTLRLCTVLDMLNMSIQITYSQYNIENVKHCQHLSFLSSNSSESAHVISIDIINTEVVIHTKAGDTGINIEFS